MVAQPTYSAKPGEIEKQWHIVDASDEVLGRLASDIAVILMGKHRPEDRHYTWYTGYPGLRLESYGDRRDRKPEDLIYHAVRRMLPKNKLAYQMIKKLKIYAGPDHPHSAQEPKPLARKGKKVVR